MEFSVEEKDSLIAAIYRIGQNLGTFEVWGNEGTVTHGLFAIAEALNNVAKAIENVAKK